MTLSRRGVVGGAIAAGLVLAGWLLWPRHEDTPEERIKHQVVLMARAAERKDLSFIMEQISPTFHSADGWGRDEVKGVLASQLFRGEWVRVFVADVGVTLESPTRAQMKGKFLLGRSDAKTLKELAARSDVQGYEIDGELELEDGQWRYVSARHQPIDPGQFL